MLGDTQVQGSLQPLKHAVTSARIKANHWGLTWLFTSTVFPGQHTNSTVACVDDKKPTEVC